MWQSKGKGSEEGDGGDCEFHVRRVCSVELVIGDDWRILRAVCCCRERKRSASDKRKNTMSVGGRSEQNRSLLSLDLGKSRWTAGNGGF